MGLTINYTVSTPRPLRLAAVKNLLAPLRDRALALDCQTVSQWLEVGPDYPLAFHIPRHAKTASDMLAPLEGWLFHATPGDGCESIQLGLCRYTGVRGWRLRGFCKTQYASRHGWEHFLCCHRQVVELLRAAQSLGLRVQVNNEGEYWENRSPAKLWRKLGESDRIVAALGGALKEVAGNRAGKIVSPIFEHPAYEHLEAEGMAARGKKIRRAVAAVRRLV